MRLIRQRTTSGSFCGALQPRELAHGRAEIGFVDDVVPVEDRSRLVAGEGHRRFLGHAGSHEIPYGGPSKIVRDLVRLP